ncbi:4'-phosphopantetheinyl transferase superfamily protein [Myxococcota bacterium]|nr:4'-phosphopantetheinyl transferase superfamily protein [Myxococcota bacterium]
MEYYDIMCGVTVGVVPIDRFIRALLPAVDHTAYSTMGSMQFSEATAWQALCGDHTTLNGFSTLKRQVEWLCGRYALKRILTRQFPSVTQPHSIHVAREEKGAPFLPEWPHLAVSIAHSNNYAGAALCTIPGISVGFDLEKIVPRDLSYLIKAGFSPREAQQLDPHDYAAVYRNWTMKEAYLKLTRQGFHTPLNQVEIFGGEIYFKSEKVANLVTTTTTLPGDHIFTLCHNTGA